jgi:hypothetical protein
MTHFTIAPWLLRPLVVAFLAPLALFSSHSLRSARAPVALPQCDDALAFPKESDLTTFLWKTRTGSSSGSPCLHGANVLLGTNNEAHLDPAFTGDYGVLACYSRKSGQFIWQMAHERLSHRANDLPLQGMNGYPAIEGSHIYYMSNRGEIVCLDVAAPGRGHKPKTRWAVDTVADLGVFRRDACDIG